MPAGTTFGAGLLASGAFAFATAVLAVGAEVETADKSRLQATMATVATLLVSPQDAERLVLAQSEGRIRLTLRSWAITTECNRCGVAGNVKTVVIAIA